MHEIIITIVCVFYVELIEALSDMNAITGTEGTN